MFVSDVTFEAQSSPGLHPQPGRPQDPGVVLPSLSLRASLTLLTRPPGMLS